MDHIRIIRDRSELEGTAYVELLRGPYQSKCWNEGSLFFDEEVFRLLEQTIERHEPAYDHYAFTSINLEGWSSITNDLVDLRGSLENALSPADVPASLRVLLQSSDQHFSTNCKALSFLISDLVAWVEESCNGYDCITILGL